MERSKRETERWRRVEEEGGGEWAAREREDEEKERAIVRLYKRNEPKRPGPFAVALTTEEKERIEEEFYVVEMVQKQKEE